MKYRIFQGTVTVDVPDKLIKLYEDNVTPFSNMTAAYLAESSGCNESSSITDIEAGIIDGIKDEVYAYSRRKEIISMAERKGIL